MVGACWDEDGTAVALLERLAGGLAASRLAAILSVVLHACQRSLAFCDAFSPVWGSLSPLEWITIVCLSMNSTQRLTGCPESVSEVVFCAEWDRRTLDCVLNNEEKEDREDIFNWQM